MQEELTSLKTAKKAKEKGFNLKVRSMFLEDKLYEDTNTKGNYNDVKWVRTWRNSPVDDTISAPTQSLLQRWLREVHKINIVIQYWTGLKPHKPVLHYRTTVNENFFGEHYVTYEEALEEALFEALNLVND